MGKKQPYAGRIGHYQTIDPLPKDVENDLIRQAQAGDTNARDRVVAANMRWAIRSASERCGPNVELDDLLQEATIGLVTAIDRFDPSRGFGFLTYARFWISQSVSHYVKTHSRHVRLPMNQLDVRRTITREMERADKELGYHTSAEGAAVRLDLRDDRAAELYDTWHQEPLSLNELVRHQKTVTPMHKLGITLMETVADPAGEDPLERMIQEEDRAKLHRALSALSDRERHIVMRYWSIHPDYYGQSCTLQDIADGMGITRERVRQIKERAISKLRGRRRRRHE